MTELNLTVDHEFLVGLEQDPPGGTTSLYLWLDGVLVNVVTSQPTQVSRQLRTLADMIDEQTGRD